MCFQLVSGNDFYLYCAQPSTLPEKLFLTHFEKSVVQVEVSLAEQNATLKERFFRRRTRGQKGQTQIVSPFKI